MEIPRELRERSYAVDTLSDAMRLGLCGLNNAPALIRTILEKDSWRKRYVHQIYEIVEFNTFAEFLKALPPEGLDYKYEDLWRLCADHPDIQALLTEAIKGKAGRPSAIESEQVSNVQKADSYKGTSRAAGLRKLKKHSLGNEQIGALFTKVLTGEISTNKALIEAGLRKAPTKSIPLSDVETMADKLIESLSRSELSQLRELIGKEIDKEFVGF